MTERRATLVTGGAGFIGSHACKELAASGNLPVTVDNLCTGNSDAVKWGPLIVVDLRDTDRIRTVLQEHNIGTVMHFAASAYVGESMQKPGDYYDNNVGGMISLLNACRASDVNNFIFSSSCATYGIPETLPITENVHQDPINPYGRTKQIGEQMLRDFSDAYGMRHVILRYFNACGADPDGELAERHDPETHLIPLVLMAARGAIKTLDVYGTDYPTEDGTCVRDYIHVSDLARAHMLAHRHLSEGGSNLAVNLGTGIGLSVLEIIDAVERLTGKKVPASFKPRRAGDPPVLFADASLAKQELGFTTRYSDIDTIVRHAAKGFGVEVRDEIAA